MDLPKEYGVSTTFNFYDLIPFAGGADIEEEEPIDLRSNSFQGGGDDAILPPQEHWIEGSKNIGPKMQEKALGFS